MQEAAKHLARSRASDRETQMMLLEQRCDRVSRFTTAQNMLTADPAGAVTILQQLLQEVDSSQVDLTTSSARYTDGHMPANGHIPFLHAWVTQTPSPVQHVMSAHQQLSSLVLLH